MSSPARFFTPNGRKRIGVGARLEIGPFRGEFV
jgi:hypothetical protein